jgi:hypothetical protein
MLILSTQKKFMSKPGTNLFDNGKRGRDEQRPISNFGLRILNLGFTSS